MGCMMQYWRLRVNPAKNCDYNVFYKTEINISKENVLRNAVKDGDLLNAFLPNVDQVEEITEETYYENMYD